MKKIVTKRAFIERARRAAKAESLTLYTDEDGYYLADEAKGEVVATGMDDELLNQRLSLLRSFEVLGD